MPYNLVYALLLPYDLLHLFWAEGITTGNVKLLRLPHLIDLRVELDYTIGICDYDHKLQVHGFHHEDGA